MPLKKKDVPTFYKNICETFLKTFDKDEPVDLIASVDNPFSVDGMNSTEERLKQVKKQEETQKRAYFGT